MNIWQKEILESLGSSPKTIFAYTSGRRTGKSYLNSIITSPNSWFELTSSITEDGSTWYSLYVGTNVAKWLRDNYNLSDQCMDTSGAPWWFASFDVHEEIYLLIKLRFA